MARGSCINLIRVELGLSGCWVLDGPRLTGWYESRRVSGRAGINRSLDMMNRQMQWGLSGHGRGGWDRMDGVIQTELSIELIEYLTVAILEQ